MKKKLLSVSGGLLLIAAILGVVYLKTPSAKDTLGAVTSPDITENHISVNGVTTWTLRQNIQTATTSLCAFPNPAGSATSTSPDGTPLVIQSGLATSSLVSVSVNITTGTSTAATYDVSTSTTQYASSSPAFAYAASIPANTLYSEYFHIMTKGMATSSDAKLTASLPNANSIVGPGQFVTVKTAGAGVGGYTYSGQCIATFRSVSAF